MSSSALSVPNRLGLPLRNRFQARLGLPWQRRLARAALLIPRIRERENEFRSLSDPQLKERADGLRGRARGGETGDAFIAEGFGLCSIAVERVLGLKPFDVQLAAGFAMFQGDLVELATGEGKTLTAAFPAFLYALAGKGVHVATVNDYLSQRDADTIGPVYNVLGLTVGVLQQKLDDAARTIAYRQDITYGTASEFGFDFLRDRLKQVGGQVPRTPFWAAWQKNQQAKGADQRVQRGQWCALVDEVDSIFVDEARTPLVISAPTRLASTEEAIVYNWADQAARDLIPRKHFQFVGKKESIELTDEGKAVLRYASPPHGPHAQAFDKLFEAVEKSLHAHHRFVRDHHYMLDDDKVVIVDESTGRPMPDRHWREGLHQAVEAKERAPIHLAAEHAAQVTYQSYFRRYEHLSGMSGTLMPNFREIRRVYGRWVIGVPTNRPVIREEMPDSVHPTEVAKYDAIVKQVDEMRQRGRPVLIGTRSVEKSEAISQRLHAAGIEHQVLNARQNEQEAAIIAQAGRPGSVTVATNMAGRGTDIILGGNIKEELESIRNDGGLSTQDRERVSADLQAEWQKLHDQVVASGGLHVIGTERHESLRIDRQLLGRSGRQGDPGSGQFFLSLEDKLLEILGPQRLAELHHLAKSGSTINWNRFRSLFMKAQQRTERKHYRQRLDMMYQQRQKQEQLGDIGADPYVD